jgi:hypothetical protein
MSMRKARTKMLTLQFPSIETQAKKMVISIPILQEPIRLRPPTTSFWRRMALTKLEKATRRATTKMTKTRTTTFTRSIAVFTMLISF